MDQLQKCAKPVPMSTHRELTTGAVFEGQTFDMMEPSRFESCPGKADHHPETSDA